MTRQEQFEKHLLERSIQVTDYAHEDVEDLIRFGATYKELITRTGFSSWDTLHRSLKRRGRQDLIDAIRAKREQGSVVGRGAKIKGGAVARNKWDASVDRMVRK